MKSTLRVTSFICLTSIIAFAVHAQIPGKNVNMVAGTQWPGGDPFLQRQNEPSISPSTRNPMHLLAGANDYRTVDLPGLPDDEETGDAWLGVFKSLDGGQKWFSNLIPGYPQDSSPQGLASPLKAFAAAADPMVRSGLSGMFYYSGIALNRPLSVNDTGNSAVFVARYNDFNNREGADPIQYLDTKIIFNGKPTNQFADKPSLAVDILRPGSLLCSAGGQFLLGGNVYVTYTIIQKVNSETLGKLYFVRSADCGATWSSPKLISGNNSINQGSVIAIDIKSGAVYIAWRRFARSPETHAIMITKSIDGGKTFSSPVTVSAITPFEQGTSGISFRTTAYPTMATDANGRVYLAWTARTGPSGDGRIMISNSPDGAVWTMPVLASANSERGHQFMPALSFTSSKLMLIYYDLRDDATIGRYTSLGGGNFTELRLLAGDRAAGHPEIVFTSQMVDNVPLAGLLSRRHTLDLRVAQTSPGVMPVFNPSQRVSQYKFGSTSSSLVDPNTNKPYIDQQAFNPPNLPLFKKGTAPFFGDYVDLSPQYPFIGSIFNNLPIPPPTFHAVWTDNRDVRAPKAPYTWKDYTPVGQGANRPSVFKSGVNTPDCIVGQAAVRNQNIYTSRITAGLVFTSPGNAKQTGRIQRAFVVQVQNTKSVVQSYRLQITNQPFGGKASFIQFPFNAPALVTLDVTVNPKSTTSRSVFVTSLLAHSPVGVVVSEITGPGGTVPPAALTSATILNLDIANPDIANPDIANPDIANAEVYTPDIANPAIANPDIANPDIANPDIANPDIANPDIANPDIANPDIANPDIANPDIANPDIANPDIANPDIANASMTDTTWPVTNTGNTTSSYSVKLAGSVPAGINLQLLLHSTYRTPVAAGCVLTTQRHENLIANIPHPTVVSPDSNGLANPDIANASIPTFSIPPGDSANVTVRAYDLVHPGLTIDASKFLTPVIVAHAINTTDLASANPLPPIALAIITGSLPDGSTSRDYGPITMKAIGGVGPLTWSLKPLDGPAFTGFPDGLTLGPNGVINGRPLNPGTFAFTIHVEDSASPKHVAERAYTIRVTSPVSVITLSLPDGAATAAYSTSLAASGGIPPYSWTLASGSSLPAGLSLASNGTISGTPTAAGSATPAFTVTDSSATPQSTTSAPLSMSVVPLSSLIQFSSQPFDTVVGQNMTVVVRPTDASGARLPGITVTLSLANNAGNADFQPRTSLTNEAGDAAFNIAIGAPGTGYTLLAVVRTVDFTGGAVSVPFNITTTVIP